MMSTGIRYPSDDGRLGAGGSGPEVPARLRGRVQIPERVVQRIAAQAASEVAASGGRSGGFLGIGEHTDLDARPEVKVDLSSDAVHLAIELAVEYPTSLRSATQRVRDHVTEQVQQLTGIGVGRVDIDIVAVGERRQEQSAGALR
ncbi:Asp23/Gls24 family envelope stress response protein [Microlunatus sp. Gsoil 973]|uniref:Asp23/Gls24 family envelope stress response protein n=1 Tax=Microlunatus sp. Gsoil 973 TaxID=2672569 RepID=UPI0012B4AD6E|nr:Asp23/Gls24 family envelope stress response protein [Microlunatus sp. Gsoil 973]QGN32103.1 Asp23/Gls24 family envelope stress response protein [Microlunatus sp. Gsoil 973]